MQRLLRRAIHLAPLVVLAIILYGEWQDALQAMDMTAHWAHIGGAIGAWLYLK